MSMPLFAVAQQEEKLPAKLNQIDKKGRRDGMWLLQTPARMGDDAYSEFGSYIAGRKYGLWYRLDSHTEVVAIERFKNDVLDGEVKYFEEGRLVCIGNYRGLNPDQKYDTIYVIDPQTMYEHMVQIETDRGTLKHGIWRFYDPMTGRLAREEDWQVDELVSRQEFAISNKDSAYYQKRNLNLPHVRKSSGKPPVKTRSTR